MTLFILTIFLAAAALVPGGLATPTGIRARTAPDACISKCRSTWGWPGHPFSNDPWGSVVDPKISDGDSGSATGSGSGGEGGVGGVEAGPSTEASSSLVSTGIITAPTSTTSSSSSTPSTTSTSSIASSSSTTSRISTQGFKASVPPSSSSSTSSSFSPPPAPKPTTSSTPPPPPSPSPSPEPAPSSSPAPAPASDSGSNSGSGSTSGPTSQSDIQAYLSAHNDARSQHGASPLTYSQDLASKAQQWANGCVFKHSGGTLGPFGENLAAGTGDSYGIPDALKSWTDEASQYNAGNPQPSHFTQVVWKATTQVGCALQLCDGIFPSTPGKAKYYVCEYSAQGNVIGQFGSNVQA